MNGVGIRLIAVLVIFGLGACASKKADDQGLVSLSSTDAVEPGVTLPPADAPAEIPPPVPPENAGLQPEAQAAVAAEPQPEAVPMPPPAEAAPVADQAPVDQMQSQTTTGAFEYRVKRGQTLMQVAFDVYGDIYQWKHLMELNPGKISDPSQLQRGMVLTLDQAPESAAQEKNGDPYLIRRGQTLGLISDDVYGTSVKWKRLWDNNRKLIKNPNRIYAGFYLYYLFNEQDRLDKLRFKGEVEAPRVPSSDGSGG